MARTVRDTALDTRAARGRLKARLEPYWRTIDQGSHIGYYKGGRGGSWVARRFLDGRYRKVTIGTADDIQDADGISVLSFAQAQEKARAWFTRQSRVAEGLEAVASGPYTVSNALNDYLAWFAKNRRGLVTAKTNAEAHIRPELGSIVVAKLTAKTVRDWLEHIAEKPARRRVGRGSPIAYKPQPKDADGRRRRRATANRVLSILKAALNRAYRDGKIASDDAWRRVKPFQSVDAPVVRYLDAAECRRVVNACPEDFRRLVQAALFTGCRYNELATLRAADFRADTGTILVRETKSGKPRHAYIAAEGRAFFSQAVTGLRGTDLVFCRADGEPWGKGHQRRPLIEACRRAGVAPAISFHVLRHTHGSLLAMQGVELQVIARQLGHADTRITERHYAHLAPNYVADTIRAGFPNLGITLNDPKVVAIASERR